MSIATGGAVVALDLKGAAESVGVSEEIVRRAIHATDPNAWPPPLKAKRAANPGSKKFSYRIAVDDLREWFARWPDA